MLILSERILILRNETGLSQEELAKESGIAYRSYRRYETGEREPNCSTLVILADFFDVSTDYLLGRKDERN